MATVTFDEGRWRTFCQLISPPADISAEQLLHTSLKQLIEFWPAAGGMVLYIAPDGTVISLEAGTLEEDGREMIAQAREGFERYIDDQQNLGVYAINDTQALYELPLHSGNNVVGLLHLVVSDEQTSPKGSRELALVIVRSIGRTADHLSMIQRAEQELADMSLITEVSNAIASDLDLRAVLHNIVDQATKVIDSETGSLLLVDEERQELYFDYMGDRAGPQVSYRIPIDKGIAGWVVQHAQGLIVNDAANDPRVYRRVDRDMEFTTQTLLTVPMRTRDKVIGVIQIVNKRGGLFTERDLRLLSTIANQAAIAIENARLYARLKEEHERLVRKEEDVRHQINRDLHDGPAQSVAAIAMNIEFIKKLLKMMPEKVEEELDHLAALVKKTNSDIRTLLFELRPLGLESQGLVETLRQYVQRFRDPQGLQLRLDSGTFDKRLTRDAEAVTFIIIQEAVNNARKHAGTKEVAIGLREEQGMLVATVSDEGKGFDLGAVEGGYEQRGSFGLLNMRERARLIGGDCSITSMPGKGTVITVRVPIAE